MRKSEGKSKTTNWRLHRQRTAKSTVKRATRSKAVQIPEGNPKKKWTTEQLKAYIKQRTKEANKNINEYRDKVKKGDIEEYRSVENVIEKLRAKAGVKGRKGAEIGLGLSGKKKAQLLEQARGLARYKQFDVWSEDYKREKEEKTQKAYESFTNNLMNKGIDVTYEEYKDMVDQLGSIGEGVLGKLDYQAALEQYSRAIRSGKKINLVQIFDDVENTIKADSTRSYSNDDKMDMIVDEIRKQSKF